MLKPLLISISPNTSADDVWLAIKILFSPRKWQLGKSQDKLKTNLKKLFHSREVLLTNSGRTGLELALKSLNLKSGDEVLCQALTCVAVPNSIIFSKAKPVFVDVVKSGFNLDPKDLAKKITPRSKAIIIQHSFGFPDDIKEILKIAKKHHLVVIEDCAVALGAKYKDKLVGTFGDMTILSFGRDKVISSVFGGALLINNKHFIKSVINLYQQLSFSNKAWIFKQLLHPILFSIIVPTYYCLKMGKFTLGKGIIFLLQKLNLITMPVSEQEKSCQISLPPAKLSNGLAILALHQLKKLDTINQHRRNIAKQYHSHLGNTLYNQAAIYLRFPILVDQPRKITREAKRKHIMLGNWYCPVIAPQGVDFNKVGYKPGTCPNAEAVSKKIINLPTHFKMKTTDINRVVSLLK